MKLRSLAVVLIIFIQPHPVLTGETSDERPDEGFYYRLTNSFLGEAYSLDTAPDPPNGPFMGKSGDYSGQYWKFTYHDGCYHLTNMYLGRERSLDTYSGGESLPFMGQSGDESGQRWHVTPAGDGYVRLTNDYLGTSRSLDTHSGSGNEVFMGQSDNYTGQLWKLTRLTRVK